MAAVSPQNQQQARQVRLPGFAPETPVGVGDALKRLTATLGIGACGGCQRRADRLNQRYVIVGREHRP